MGRAALISVASWLAMASTAHADPDTLGKLLGKIDAVAKEVSKVRGLPLKHAIPNDVVDKAELHARLVKMAGEDKTAAETKAEGIALERWGMIPPGTDYTKMVLDLLTDQIAGYYDPETKKLTISQSAGDDPGWAEMVLAHELDHGLQDQSFDLKKFEDLPDSEGDAATARHALTEGDGIALMLEVMLIRNHAPIPWGNPEIADAIAKAMSAPSAPPGGEQDPMDKAPLALRESMIFPYREGFAFVAALRRTKPWTAVDDAFTKRPPRSTEQIIHPERYLANDEPVPVSLSVPTGWTKLQETVWGELGFDLWLRSHGVGADVAAEASTGWGGDRTMVIARGNARVGLAHTVWDSEPDAIEAFEAAGKAIAESVIGGRVEASSTRFQVMALDGTASSVERRGADVVIIHGAPAYALKALEAQVPKP